MFDLGWTELLVIGIVALIVVGPKDLPVLFRNVGRFVGKAKGMAREFSSAMNQAADESGVKDVASGLKAANNPLNTAMDSVKDAAKSFNFDPDSETGKLAAERKAKAQELKDGAEARKAAVADANAAAAKGPDFGGEKAQAASKPAPAKKAAPTKPAATKKPATKAAAAKKPAARKPAAKKTAPKDKA
jgi:sec-independent protein translocase protein TatB